MRRYIFAERGGIYIIDLKKTLRELERAKALVSEIVRRGESVLFVCTKSQLNEIIRAEAERSGAFYVTERWLGGMLTNFQTIKKNIRRLKELERGVEEGAFEFYTKKEQLLLSREREKLDRYLSGIKDMTRLPGCLFVVDSRKEDIAVAEANKLGIPVIAIADTNADPDELTIAIAGNDDAIRSVSLICRPRWPKCRPSYEPPPPRKKKKPSRIPATAQWPYRNVIRVDVQRVNGVDRDPK
jgi:small subunit ribosomal protein S2